MRRIAATREDVGLPPHVSSSPSFAGRVLAALDRDAAPAPFEALVGHVRTLVAFADALDVRAAVRQGLGGAKAADGADRLALDAALLAGDDDAFAWRRLAAEAGLGFEIVDLGPPVPPPLDLAAVDGVQAILRYARSQADADARHAIGTALSGVRPDDARTLLTVAGERADLLEVIAKGAVAEAGRFAHGLATRQRGLQAARRLGGDRAGRAVRQLSAAARADASRAGAHRGRLRRRARVRAAVGGRRPAGRARRRAGQRAAPHRRARRCHAGRHLPRRAGRRRSRGARCRCASSRSAPRRSTRTPSARASGTSAMPARRSRTAVRRPRSTASPSTPRWRTSTPRTRASTAQPAPTPRRWRARSTTTS